MAKPLAVRLKRKHEKRVAGGHPWVFSNEIDGDVAALPPGGQVDVYEASGKHLGRGYANPASLIAVRLLTRSRADDVDNVDFWIRTLRFAEAHRAIVCPGRRSLRLVHGDGDRASGLVIDRYDDVLAVQLNSLGVDARADTIRAAIEAVLVPRGVVRRSDARSRAREGLEPDDGVWWGDVPDVVEIDELGVRFGVDVQGGQKTGHFYDQADNRAFAAGFCGGRSVLDVYAHDGAWALHALRGGAREATVIDQSEGACAAAVANAARNGVTDRLVAVHGEAGATLERFVTQGRRFDVVVVDPPAFARSRKVATQALKGYRRVFGLALALVEPGGLFFPSSCSYHVEESRFLEAIVAAARDAGRDLVVVRRGEQSPDHPVRPEVPETRYLKSWAFRVRLAS